MSLSFRLVIAAFVFYELLYAACPSTYHSFTYGGECNKAARDLKRGSPGSHLN